MYYRNPKQQKLGFKLDDHRNEKKKITVSDTRGEEIQEIVQWIDDGFGKLLDELMKLIVFSG